MKSRAVPVLALAFALSCAAPERPAPAPSNDPVARLQAMAQGLDRLAWDVITEEEAGGTAMDAGYKVQGRFVRGEGVRIKATAMGAAHGMGRGAPPGPNLHQLMFTPDRVAVGLSVLTFESGQNTQSFPHLLLRSVRGDPDHAAVDPRLLPGNDPILHQYDEPLISYQLSPAILFGHEPDLAPVGTETVNRAACLVLRSRYTADAAARAGPAGWYPHDSVEKKFFIEESSGLLAALEITVTTGAKARRTRYEVISRQEYQGLMLPRHVTVAGDTPDGPRRARHRIDLDIGDT
jgi:hypothetical protein